MTHPDVPAEQAHIDRSYERLGAMRASAEAMLADAFGEKGGTFQAVTERDIRVRNSLGRLEHLQLGREALVFGRIDLARGATTGSGPDGAGAERGDADEPASFHIGRLAVSDVDQEPLVVDWRAPVAEPFYRATGAQPMGLIRRRHFLTEGRLVTDIEDELFDVEGDEPGAGLGLSGSQVLIASLERSRTGRMRDIVATVQREQDEIIRGPLPGILVVQGGPGTGKTAVALHRAAYLLYTHRFPLESQGVLVVGPNPTFLRYIEHVLPSLDETGVELSTVTALYHRSRPSKSESVAAAALKGDPRMVQMIAHAVADRQRPLRRTVEVPFGSRILRVTAAMSAQLVSAVKRRPGTHNARRRVLESVLWRHFVEQITAAETDRERAERRDDDQRITAEELGAVLRKEPAMAEALDRMWPVLTPEQFLNDLFGARPLLELSAGPHLSSREIDLLQRERSHPGEHPGWTEADIPLLDEAAALLGSRRRAGDDPGEQLPTFGHIVIDEAQDLSPMQLRMVARRSLSGSMTVVGDIAQATGSWVPGSWEQVVSYLPARRGWRLTELTVSYRTPAEIMELAGRVLAVVAPEMSIPESVRSASEPPRIERVGPARPGPDAPTTAAGDPAGRLIDALGRFVDREFERHPGDTIAMIVPRTLIPDVAARLTDRGVEFGTAGQRALDLPITVLAIDDAKGLEFDSVVVADPSRVVAETAQGLRSLYVAFTRATQRLTVLYSDELPVPLLGAVSQVP